MTPVLRVSTSGTDSDFDVKLIDVYPNNYRDPQAAGGRRGRRGAPGVVPMAGYQQLVRGEPFRGKFRNSRLKPEPFRPGQPAKIEFAMPDVLHTFLPGHRIMVQIQSSWFPLTDRNPQKFLDIPAAKASDFKKALERVYRGGCGRQPAGRARDRVAGGGPRMDSIAVCMMAAGAGALIAWMLTRAPELRGWRLSQMILVAGGFAAAGWLLRQTHGNPDMGAGIILILIIVLTAFLLAPNLAFYVGAGLSDFLDPQDWTPAEEEIALRPIRRLIDNDRFYQALGDLEALLKRHKPTYEALMLHAKLLHHFGRWDDTAGALLKAIPLSHTTAQQLTVMELLAALGDRLSGTPEAAVPGTRRRRLQHELVLFQAGAADRLLHKAIPPGDYEVEEIIQGRQRWLKLAGENWGNAEGCWEAAREIEAATVPPHKQGCFWQIGRMHQAITTVFKASRACRPRRKPANCSRKPAV